MPLQYNNKSRSKWTVTVVVHHRVTTCLLLHYCSTDWLKLLSDRLYLVLIIHLLIALLSATSFILLPSAMATSSSRSAFVRFGPSSTMQQQLVSFLMIFLLLSVSLLVAPATAATERRQQHTQHHHHPAAANGGSNSRKPPPIIGEESSGKNRRSAGKSLSHSYRSFINTQTVAAIKLSY